MRIFIGFYVRLMKTRNVLMVDLPVEMQILFLYLGFLNTTLYLLFKEISRDDGLVEQVLCN